MEEKMNEGRCEKCGGTCSCGSCSMKSRGCGCPHHMVVPAMITLIGLAFLLGALNVLTMYAVSVIWPILLIVVGLMKLSKGSCKCC